MSLLERLRDEERERDGGGGSSNSSVREGGSEIESELREIVEALADGYVFVHAVADGLCGRASPRYVDYGHVWIPSEWLSVVQQTQRALLQAVQDGPGKTKEQPAVPHSVEACVGVRRDELRSAVTLSSLALGSAQLRDFDWKLKLALSSDRHSTLQTPLLALALDVQRHDPPHDPRSAVCDTSRDAVTVELSAAELGTLITALENASKVVQQLK